MKDERRKTSPLWQEVEVEVEVELGFSSSRVVGSASVMRIFPYLISGITRSFSTTTTRTSFEARTRFHPGLIDTDVRLECVREPTRAVLIFSQGLKEFSYTSSKCIRLDQKDPISGELFSRKTYCIRMYPPEKA